MPEVTVKGLKVHYDGPEPETLVGRHPLVLLHGAAGNRLVWDRVLALLLEQGLSALALDLPGHGRSGGTSHGFIEPMAHALEALAEEMDWRKFFLAGHSMGGAVALSYALFYPRRLAGLGLIATGARLRVAPVILQLLEDDYTKAIEFAVEDLVSPKVEAGLRVRLAEIMLAAGARTAQDDFTACDNFNVMGKLSALELPTLVVVGAADTMTPVKYSRYLADTIRGARLEIIPEAGHMLMFEAPESLADILGSLVRGA